MKHLEQLEPISKKIWNIVRIAIFLIKKGLNKKVFMDLNMMMKRGKIAGKALKNLMFHKHHHHHNIHQFFTSQGGTAGQHGTANNLPSDDEPREYEFSCSNTPLYTNYFLKKRKSHKKNTQYSMPSPLPLEDCENINLEHVNKVMEIMLRNEVIGDGGQNCTPSPVLPGLGFGRSPAVRQLRITDSPFPVQNSEDDKHVDQAAEDFIMKFYSQLKQQKF